MKVKKRQFEVFGPIENGDISTVPSKSDPNSKRNLVQKIKKVCFNLILDIPTTPSDLSDLIEKATWTSERDGSCTFIYNDSCEFGRIAPNMSLQTHRHTVLVHIL